MLGLLKNLPPSYDQELGIEGNFDKFFEWGLALKHPQVQIPEIGEQLGFGVRMHPIGFMVVYLSQPNRGMQTMNTYGSVRADIFPSGVRYEDDIHSHGFDFHSGVIAGELGNTRHYPDWERGVSDGSGYVGYETRVDFEGNNHTVQATDATVVISRSEAEELSRGNTYTMAPRDDFHSVSSDGSTVTIFCKTPTYQGHDGLALVLKKPELPTPPETY